MVIQTNTLTNPFDAEEREMLKYLIKFGELPLEVKTDDDDTVEITVGEFVINELKQDDLLSVNPVYNKAMEFFENNYQNEGFIALKFFVNNIEPDISQLASDILGKEYVLSKIHGKFSRIEEETELLHRLIPKVVGELKWKKIKVMLEEKKAALNKMEKSGDFDGALELMKEIATWEQVKTHVSKVMGGRTII